MNRRELLASIGCLTAMPHALAQKIPDTVRIIMPFATGNPMDASVRLLAEALRKTSPHNYIVDNKPGAGALIGTIDLTKSKPDGSTILYTTGGHTTNAVVHTKLPFDPIADFTPITQLTSTPGFVMMVGNDSPYRTLEQFIAAARARPNSLTYASAGIGNTTHIVGALFAKSANIELIHVPYKGSSNLDLISGRVDCSFLGSSLAQVLIDDKRVRGLAITGPKRTPKLPDVPTLEERGFKGVDIPSWGGFLGPKGMSAETANLLHAYIKKAVADPDYVRGIEKFGDSEIVVTQPQEFGRYLRSEIARYEKLLPPLNIKLE